MKNSIPLIVQKANEIEGTAHNLSEKLKELAYNDELFCQISHNSVDPTILLYTIFIMACFVGYYVVWKVTPSLHTPLMSITNSISGVIIISAMLAASADTWNVASIFGLVAVFLAALNVFGGFIVTKRMLGMFKKK